MDKTITWLCLGDSYTIGESVMLHQNFPYQGLQLLRASKWKISAPEIVAKTGWTTDELEAAMNDYSFAENYSFVTLLIGVNNQYRGRTVETYHADFERLVRHAIRLANNKPDRVFVLSIPDYSVMPFAKEMEKDKIAREIDLFNSTNRALSIQYKCHYIDITEDSRQASDDSGLVAEDHLHPSAAAYKIWAEKLVKEVKNVFH